MNNIHIEVGLAYIGAYAILAAALALASSLA